MSYIPCNNGTTIHTQTYTITSNGTKDLGEEHEYRYINESIPIPPTVDTASLVTSVNGKSISFTGENNKFYLIVGNYASSSASLGWSGPGTLSISGGSVYGGGTHEQNRIGAGSSGCNHGTCDGIVKGTGGTISATWNSSAGNGGYSMYVYKLT